MKTLDRAKEIVSRMTLEEKADFFSGKNYWETKDIERLGLKSVIMTYGSNGLRKQINGQNYAGFYESEPAVCFPTGALAACSWDPELLERMGEAVGDKALREGVGMIMGPTIDIKRSPLGGNNYDSFSEDPKLTAELAVGYVKGVQSKGIGACVQHFAASNQEFAKMINDSVVDEHALYDIYFMPFYEVISRTDPWAILASANKVNGVYVTESYWLLTNVLRERFGFKGMVISDWAATADSANSVTAGLNLEMPYSGPESGKKILDAIKNHELNEASLDNAVTRTVEMLLKSHANENRPSRTDEMDHELAREIAEKSAVLLKNDGILPLSDQRVAFIGGFAKNPRFQGIGQKKINPTQIENAYDEAIKNGYNVKYAQGYPMNDQEDAESLLVEALEVADAVETVVVFIGIPEDFESENTDRKDLMLPKTHLKLVNEIAKINSNMVVVLSCGGPVDMRWDKDAKAVLLTYLAGQASGGATVNLLWGKVNPSGRLAESWPVRLEDNPSYGRFSNNRAYSEYRESVFVGYRFYEDTGTAVAYPFGHGLSYTRFTYDNFKVTELGNNNFEVSVDVTNIGSRDGADVVQLYVGLADSKIVRARKELKSFKKVYVKAGMTETVTMRLGRAAFAYHNPVCHRISVESGEYTLYLCRNSHINRLTATVNVLGDQRDELTMVGSNGLKAYKKIAFPLDIPDDDFFIHLGYTPAYKDTKRVYQYDRNSALIDIKETLIGRILFRKLERRLAYIAKHTGSFEADTKLQEMVECMPLRSMNMVHLLDLEQVEGIVDIANRHYLSGLKKLHLCGRIKRKSNKCD